jgi:hypothetical protein
MARPKHVIDGVEYTLELCRETGATVLAPVVKPRCWRCRDDLHFASELRRRECNGCERDRCED